MSFHSLLFGAKYNGTIEETISVTKGRKILRTINYRSYIFSVYLSIQSDFQTISRSQLNVDVECNSHLLYKLKLSGQCLLCELFVRYQTEFYWLSNTESYSIKAVAIEKIFIKYYDGHRRIIFVIEKKNACDLIVSVRW